MNHAITFTPERINERIKYIQSDVTDHKRKGDQP